MNTTATPPLRVAAVRYAPAVLAQVDGLAAAAGETRSDFLRRLVDERLAQLAGQDAPATVMKSG